MRTKSILVAGACALGLASPAWAAPGQCFDANGTALGPVYDTESPDTRFVNWIQARGGECRALRADEVTLYRGQRNDYPADFGRGARQMPPADVAPGAPRSVPPVGTITTWDGDPVAARERVITYYRTQQPNVAVTDTGRVLQLSDGGYWRVYETVYADGTRRQTAVQIRPNRQYVIMESEDGSTWSEVIDLDE